MDQNEKGRTGANGAADGSIYDLNGLIDTMKAQNKILGHIEEKLGVIMMALCALVGIFLASS